MHDAGKVGIPDDILFKETSLTPQEWNIMKTHTTIGARIFENAKSPVLMTAREIALTHHEKYDGTGYPLGLKKDEIPLSGRIMAIADIYDAIRSKRPYKPEVPHDRVVKIMTEGDDKIKPTDFDPLLLKVFVDKADEFDQIYERYRD